MMIIAEHTHTERQARFHFNVRLMNMTCVHNMHKLPTQQPTNQPANINNNTKNTLRRRENLRAPTQTIEYYFGQFWSTHACARATLLICHASAMSMSRSQCPGTLFGAYECSSSTHTHTYKIFARCTLDVYVYVREFKPCECNI